MSKELTFLPTSIATADSYHPIVLSEKTTVRTLFKATIVNNPNNSEKSVKGNLVITRKSKSMDGFDSEKITRKSIKAEQEVSISLDTTETYNLFCGLKDLYDFNETNPIPKELVTFVKEDERLKQLQNLIKDNEKFAELLKNTDTSRINFWNTAINIEKFNRVMENFNDNINNSKELFWQNFFTQNNFILSQIFVLPMIIYKEQAYLGGKSFDNRGGKYADFVYENINTHNVAIIEIKTPMSSL